MAKKQEDEKKLPSIDTAAVEKAVKIDLSVKPEVRTEAPKNSWEIKDRVYLLTNDKRPLSKSIRSSEIFWFDEEKGYERELMYTTNQRTPFVDEMQGEKRLAHIIFRNGILQVPKEKTVLQKLLSLYHPHRDILFEEVNKVKEAADELDFMEVQLEAMNTAKNLEIDMAEAVMRVEIGSDVTKMSSKELRRDLLMFAKAKPVLFLELVYDDNVQLRNIAITAAEQGIISLSQDQRTFNWASTGRKLMTVPFDENPYSALAHWFKTDEGTEVFSSIEKRLK